MHNPNSTTRRISTAANPPEGKNNSIAILSASLLTLVAIGCVSMGLWRVGTDLDWAGGFVFQNGFLSHWQVCIGAAVAVQYASRRLTRNRYRTVPV